MQCLEDNAKVIGMHLSLFIRALSNLLIYRNGVVIIATLSPVIVQEVPRKCGVAYEKIRGVLSE